MIKGQNIHYAHRKFNILNAIDIHVKNGDFVAIVGPNGAGKSTLLSVLANEISQRGLESIAFKDKSFKAWDLKELAWHKAKFSQFNALDIPLKVEDVVMMGRYPYFNAVPQKEDRKIVDACMKETNVDHLKSRDYNSLSGGEKQRVHLARTLSQLRNPINNKLLLLDEPLNNLDVKHQYKALQTIKDFTQQDNAAIVVLHDLNMAAQFADQILLLKAGTVVAYGKPQDVFTEDIISETYNFPCTIINNPITKNPMIIFG
jgi:iron complex transport system ATP-binding protein